MAAPGAALEAVLRRDRLVVLVALVGVAALAWGHLAVMALSGMPDGSSMTMTRTRPWDVSYFVETLVMWTMMMVGMMIPSAAPMILLFAALQRSSRPQSAAHPGTALFTAGYLVDWTAFSLVATLAQWGLSGAAFLSPVMESASLTPVGLLLLTAGAYQLTPLKSGCLRRCRSPFEFLVYRRRPGRLGAFLMGLDHGAYCVGCCWLLMALLFAFGVMNLLWVAAISVFVLSEKLLRVGPLVGRIGGGLMLVAGATLLLVR